MHPGPMNRGVEIDSAVADGPQSVILPQVTFGIAVRMAVMSILAGNWNSPGFRRRASTRTDDLGLSRAVPQPSAGPAPQAPGRPPA